MDEIAKLRRLQGVTLVALLGTLAIAILGRLDRPPPPGPAPAPAPLGPLEDAAARKSVALLGSRVAALEAAPPPPRGARVDASYDRRYVCRIANERKGLTAEVRKIDGAGDPKRFSLSPATSSSGRIPIEPDLGPIGADRHGLLFVQALVRTDNGIREKEKHPHRLSLVCVDRGGAEQQSDLAGCFFMAASRPEDLLLKTAANSTAFVVTDGARLELSVDAATLEAYLSEGGLLEVVFRVGPLVVFEGPVSR
jgi:hypothetical protein